MGCSINAYVNVDQAALQALAVANGLNLKDYTQGKVAAHLYVQHHLSLNSFEAEDFSYMYNKACDVHEIWTFCSCKFVRDDERFNDYQYIKVQEDKQGKYWPPCLDGPPIHYVRDDKTAREVAAAFEDWFANDDRLLYFARWLRDTAQWCTRYNCD